MRWLKWIFFAIIIVIVLAVWKPENRNKLPELPGLNIQQWTSLQAAVDSRLNRKNYVPLSEISLSLQQAVIAVEDNRFYQHGGIDFESIFRAVLINMQSGELREGGSTITQQLVKNLFLTQERTWGRKMIEAPLSLLMEWKYPKEEILEMYLNSVYFGSGAYGIGEASRTYFAKAPKVLTLAESAMLAGLPNAPSILSPLVDFQAAKQRQAVVLAALVRYGYIGPQLAEEAKNTPLRLTK